jgi:hypothetical protein
MIPIRLALVALALTATVGCSMIGAPERASDTQNLFGISDDISAVRMTQSDSLKVSDPNLRTTLPRSFQLPED